MISLPLLGLIVLLNVLSYYVLSQRFSNLEDKTLQQDVQRVLNSLQSQQDYLRATTRDWASWDDTYQFMEDRNQRYLDLNVSPDSFSNLNINLFVLLDTQGQVVLSKQLDLSGQQISSIEADYFEQHPNLINAGDSRQEVDGIALLPTGPMLISARPILTRQGTGPAQGTLVLGRSIDSALVNKLSAALSFDITIRRFNDPDLPADFQSVSQLSAHNVLCQALDQNTIAGYVLIDDIDGHPVLILRVATSRDIHQQGRETITIFATGTVLVGAIFTVLMLVTVERLWVRR
ncbi:MAG TPA: CHASE4 domain-containing protein, partial [Aggregatilineaceae bacterium]|nr:CHASE4 domain-containing protein [Aggregatilineaceae bacterium]